MSTTSTVTPGVLPGHKGWVSVKIVENFWQSYHTHVICGNKINKARPTGTSWPCGLWARPLSTTKAWSKKQSQLSFSPDPWGVDQAQTQVPPFDDAYLKFWILGTLVHGPNPLYESNTNLEALRRVLEELPSNNLPRVLHLQMDNGAITKINTCLDS